MSYNLILLIIFPLVFIVLFVRQVNIDSQKYWKEYRERDRLGDLHILYELRKYYIQNNIPAVEKFDEAIKEIEKCVNY